jgi:hypothetical protein
MTSGSLVVNIVDSFSKTENNHSIKTKRSWSFAFSRPLFALSLQHLALGFPRCPFSVVLSALSFQRLTLALIALFLNT